MPSQDKSSNVQVELHNTELVFLDPGTVCWQVNLANSRSQIKAKIEMLRVMRHSHCQQMVGAATHSTIDKLPKAGRGST